jgi:hypothetical protein
VIFREETTRKEQTDDAAADVDEEVIPAAGMPRGSSSKC